MDLSQLVPATTESIIIVEKKTMLDRDFDFSWTFTYFWESGNFYRSIAEAPSENVHEGNVKDFHLTHIPLDHIFPTDIDGLTLVPLQSSTNAFVKTPKFTVYDEDEPYQVPRRFLHEAHVLEALAKSPHPNIVKYFGCVLKRGMVAGICLERCAQSLDERMQCSDKQIAKQYVMDCVERAVKHLHYLGYCHNDISPFNVMFRDDGSLALIDFDTCQPIDRKIDKKGSPRFCNTASTISRPENDFYSIAKLEKYLATGEYPMRN